LNAYRRIAFLPDTFHEVNGVAHTSRHLERFVRARQIPFLSVRPGPKQDMSTDGVVTMIDLKRSRFSFALDTNLDCDPFVLRHAPLVMREAKAKGVELIHITGPGDMGILGCYIAWKLRLPVVMGWHTNLHQYAGSRVKRLFDRVPDRFNRSAGEFTEKQALSFLGKFYSRARLILAPNPELTGFCHDLTGRPARLMPRGVDVELFAPEKRARDGVRFRIGYVGRLTPEKNVRFLAELGEKLRRVARHDFEFCIVGQGSEAEWLTAHVPNATLTGVLAGEGLARAYANFDLFVFPSRTDTFGNVVLEAMASGVPCVVTSEGGPRFLVQSGITGYVARDSADFVRCVTGLMNDLVAHHLMKESARNYACRLSWASIFERVFRHYDACLSISEGSRKPVAPDRICLSA